MAKIGDYKIADVYGGGYSSLDAEYGSIFTGYRANISEMGVTTNPRVANILKEFSEKIAPGQKVIELQWLLPEVFEAMPKQQLKEVNRLSKLTGAEAVVHGPLIEASGMGEQGWSETNREAAERQMLDVLEKAHEVNPDGSSPVTFHSSARLPASETRPARPEEKEEGEEITEKLLLIDQESGQVLATKREVLHRPEMYKTKDGEVVLKHGKPVPIPLEKGKIFTAEERVSSLNHSQWEENLTKLLAPKARAERILDETYHIGQKILIKELQGDFEYVQNLNPKQSEIYSRYRNVKKELDDIELHLNSLFEKAYKYGSEHEKRKLSDLSKIYQGTMQEGAKIDLKQQSAALQLLLDGLWHMNPKQFSPINEFAMNKSANTFGNVAFNAYQKFKDKTPILSIENPPAWMGAFGRGEELKNLVEKSRGQFVKRAVEGGMSEGTAKDQAEKLIGVTWDVGHINQLRRFGFTEEDVIKETEKVAPYVKHVHLSDNFGNENTELPMGMGNVPLKEMMDKLGDRGKKARKIIEAGSWWTHFQSSPMGLSFEALGSPVYSMKMAPYWNQTMGIETGYPTRIGPTLPQINYETFGGGFSQLPAELGGQMGGAGGSRLGGTPMQ